MSFDDMPEMPRMLLPGAHEYADRILAGSKKAAVDYRTVMDVPYGEDYWQKVDFYLPKDRSARDLPVMCFLHGGAFRNGFKEWMGFMAPPLVDLPAVFVSFSYRLAPATRFPEIMHDCFDALRLVYEQVGQHGGDRARIYVGGHSAGGHLAALLALRRDQSEARGMPGDVVKGCFPVSGLFDLRFDQAVPGGVLERTHGELFYDAGIEGDVSPLTLVAGNKTPFFVTWGENDLEEIVSTSESFVTALRDEPCTVEEHVWPRYGHFDTNEAQGVATDIWVQRARAWMQSPPRRR
jgi:arylformamidase